MGGNGGSLAPSRRVGSPDWVLLVTVPRFCVEGPPARRAIFNTALTPPPAAVVEAEVVSLFVAGADKEPNLTPGTTPRAPLFTNHLMKVIKEKENRDNREKEKKNVRLVKYIIL